MSGVILFIKALPEILALISRLGVLFDALVTEAKRQNLNQWLDELEHKVDQLKNAKTKEDKFNAAHGLVDSIRTLK